MQKKQKIGYHVSHHNFIAFFSNDFLGGALVFVLHGVMLSPCSWPGLSKHVWNVQVIVGFHALKTITL